MVVIDWMIGLTRYNTGRVFETWDAVVSWNRWAVDWSKNQFPFSTQDYPQLIPTAWAMIYNFTGNQQVQFFSKGIMPLFPLLIILIIFSMGLKAKNYGYFIALIGLRYLFKKLAGELIIAGYVDMAITFFTLLAILFLYYYFRSESLEEKKQNILLAVIFACGASVTKQSGLYIVLVVGIFVMHFVYTIIKSGNFKDNRNYFALLVVILIIIILPWYLMKNIEFIQGIDTSQLSGSVIVTQTVHQTEDIFEIYKKAMISLGNPIYLFVLVLPATLVVDKFWKLISVLFVIPYTTIWAIYVSYDTRNLTIVLPLVAILVGLAMSWLIKSALDIAERIKIGKVPLVGLIVFIFVLMIVLNFFLPQATLVSKQIEKQKLIFSPSLNAQLYEYRDQKGLQGKILTNYPIHFLPELEGYQISYAFQDLDLRLLKNKCKILPNNKHRWFN